MIAKPLLKRRSLLPGLLLFLALSSVAPAELPVSPREQEWVLSGTGTLEVLRFLDVYDAALYVGRVSGEDSVRPLRLNFDIRRPVKAKYLIKYTRPVLEKNLPPNLLQEMASFLDEVSALWTDTVEGDRVSLVFEPGSGLFLSKNDLPQGFVPGARFAQLYFAIWLGAEPASERLKEALLRGAPELRREFDLLLKEAFSPAAPPPAA